MTEEKKVTEESLAANTAIVLVSPIKAGNIGSVARVMGNTGFKDLRLVKPVEYENDDGFSMACNSCALLLDATRYDDLPSAIADRTLVLGATRRAGKARTPLFGLDAAVERVRGLSIENSVALVFGREDHGLSNDEIDLCDMLFEIPTHDDNPSLNLSQAVFAVCHALFSSKEAESVPPMELAEREELLLMYDHLERTLSGLGYGDEGADHLLEIIMRNFRRLFGRTGLMPKEVNMLRGIFAQIEERSSAQSSEPRP